MNDQSEGYGGNREIIERLGGKEEAILGLRKVNVGAGNFGSDV